MTLREMQIVSIVQSSYRMVSELTLAQIRGGFSPSSALIWRGRKRDAVQP